MITIYQLKNFFSAKLILGFDFLHNYARDIQLILLFMSIIDLLLNNIIFILGLTKFSKTLVDSN